MGDDPNGWKRDFDRRSEEFHSRSAEERNELALAFVCRADRREKGLEQVRRRYPEAAREILDSYVYHFFCELPEACRDFLAWMELRAREGEHDIHYGVLWEMAYHLHNGFQVQALMPYGRADVHSDLKEIQECLSREDTGSAAEILEALIERFEGGESPPVID